MGARQLGGGPSRVSVASLRESRALKWLATNSHAINHYIDKVINFDAGEIFRQAGRVLLGWGFADGPMASGKSGLERDFLSGQAGGEAPWWLGCRVYRHREPSM